MTTIALEHVTKRYANGAIAVNDLSLDIASGELVVLVGPSGCGKTTTLRMIAGLEGPTEGVIRLGGCRADRMSIRERDVALVFQQPALYPHLNVRENLAFGLAMRQGTGRLSRGLARWFAWGRYEAIVGAERDRAARVERAAGLLGLEDLLERLPAQLSGGEQQRVALGRALVREPAILLFDEPLSNLDGPLRSEMRRQLHLLHRRFPATMLYVTHDPVEALALADRVVVLRGGVVQQVDRPLTVHDRPGNRFVAGFIGWPPMSFVDGQLTTEGPRLGLKAGDGVLPLPVSWQRHVGRAVTVGIRPEFVSLTRTQAAASSMRMQLTLVELLGRNCLASFRRGAWTVTALLPRDGAFSGALAEEATYEVFWDMSQAHLFERASGVALSGPDDRSADG